MNRDEMRTGSLDYFGHAIYEGDIMLQRHTAAYGGVVRWSDETDEWVLRRYGMDIPLEEMLDDYGVLESVYDVEPYNRRLYD